MTPGRAQIRREGARVVAVDAHILTGKYQGSRTWLEGILKELPSVAPSNHYVVYSHDPVRAREICRGPNVSHVEMPEWSAWRRLITFWPFARLRDRFDVLMTQYIAPPLLAGPQIVVIHDILFESHPDLFRRSDRIRNKLLVRWSARQATRIITVSNYSKQAIISRYHVSEDKIVIAPNGVTAIRPSNSRLLSRPFALFVGRIEPRKNLGLLVQAMDRLETRDLLLVVVGKADFQAGSDIAQLRSRPYALHLQDVPPEELAALYRDAAVVVFPSRAEGFGIPVIEALAYGAQVVCSSSTALPEVAGEFAFYFDPESTNSVETLSERIASALDNPIARDQGALQLHLSKFGWRHSAEAVAHAIDASGPR